MSMGPARCERHDGSGMQSSAPCTCAPAVRDLADATDISDFLIPKFATVVQRTDEQIAGDKLLGEVLNSYEIPISHFVYDEKADPEVWAQVFEPTLYWAYLGGQCIGTVEFHPDGTSTWYPPTLLWEGDQA